MERNHNTDPDKLNETLLSHQIDVDAIRADNFDTYFENRFNALLNLIEGATGKPVSGREEKPAELTFFDISESEVVDE